MFIVNNFTPIIFSCTRLLSFKAYDLIASGKKLKIIFKYNTIINVKTLSGASCTENVCSCVIMNLQRAWHTVSWFLTSTVIRNESVENTVKGESLVILCPLCSFPCAYLCAPDPSGASSTGFS